MAIEVNGTSVSSINFNGTNVTEVWACDTTNAVCKKVFPADRLCMCVRICPPDYCLSSDGKTIVVDETSVCNTSNRSSGFGYSGSGVSYEGEIIPICDRADRKQLKVCTYINCRNREIVELGSLYYCVMMLACSSTTSNDWCVTLQAIDVDTGGTANVCTKLYDFDLRPTCVVCSCITGIPVSMEDPGVLCGCSDGRSGAKIIACTLRGTPTTTMACTCQVISTYWSFQGDNSPMCSSACVGVYINLPAALCNRWKLSFIQCSTGQILCVCCFWLSATSGYCHEFDIEVPS